MSRSWWQTSLVDSDIKPQPIITVYTKPDCVQCDMTKKWLDGHGFKDAYAVADILEIANLAAAKSIGLLSAPVVLVSVDGVPGNEEMWAGFQPAQLQKHLAA